MVSFVTKEQKGGTMKDKLISAEQLKEMLMPTCITCDPYNASWSVSRIRAMIDEMQESVVRCKDCARYADKEFCTVMNQRTPKAGHCFKGIRKAR